MRSRFSTASSNSISARLRLAEEEHPAHGGHLAPLVYGDEAEGLQVAAGELADGSERLGSGSEVERFRVEPEQRLLVEALASREAPKLLDQLRVGAAIGRAHPDVYAGGRTLPGEMVRPARAGMDLQREHLRPPPWGESRSRERCPADAIADEAGQGLLQIERVGHASHVPAPILWSWRSSNAPNSTYCRFRSRKAS